MQQPERNPGRAKGRGGFTLIEVIIALAIFMLGAVAIVRIFPPALAAIQGSGEQTNGARLASSAIERLNTRIAAASVSSVPDAIYFGAADGTYNTVFGGAFSGTVNRNRSLPRNAQLVGNGNPANESALKLGNSPANSGSYVRGERHRVMSDNSGNLFVLTNFPYSDTVEPTLASEDSVEGVRIIRVDGATAPAFYFDFSDARLASSGDSWSNAADPRFPQGIGGDFTYYISYRWIEADGANTKHGVEEESYVFPDPGMNPPPVPGSAPPDDLKAALSDQVVTAATPGRPLALLEAEVKVRVVRALGSAGTPVEGESQSGLVRVPATAGITVGSPILVSYGVRDWRSLVVDQSPVDGVATVPTRGLDEANYGDEVAAVAYSAPDSIGRTQQPVRRGFCIPKGDDSCAEVGDALAAVKSDGNETNRVLFHTDANGLGGLPAPRVRIAYRPLNGWGVQAAVAARTYTPYYDFVPAPSYRPEIWRLYSWKVGSSEIYLQPNEAGKVLQITFEYQDGSGRHLVKNRIVTVDGDLRRASAVDVRTGYNGAGGNVAVAELTDLNGNFGPNVTAILSVKGLSVQARAVWADNQGRYRQTTVTDYRRSS